MVVSIDEVNNGNAVFGHFFVAEYGDGRLPEFVFILAAAAAEIVFHFFFEQLFVLGIVQYQHTRPFKIAFKNGIYKLPASVEGIFYRRVIFAAATGRQQDDCNEYKRFL